MPDAEARLSALEDKIRSDAILARDAIREQLARDSEQKLTAAKTEIARDAEKLYQRETRQAEAERDSKVAMAAAESRVRLIKERNAIRESVLAALTEKLRAFTGTDGYRPYLLANVSEALAMVNAVGAQAIADPDEEAGPRGCVIYLTPRDCAAFADDIRALAPTAEPAPGGDDMIGGVKTDNPSSGIFADNTLKKKVDLCAEEIFELCGLNIDWQV